MNFIETDRLILRSWQKQDLESFKRMNKDERVMQYSGKILNDKESEDYYKKITAHFEWHNFGLFAVEIKSMSTFIGYIGITIAPYDFWPMNRPCVEIGWRLMYECWGKGYATEGAKASLKYCSEVLKLNEVVAFTKNNNSKSIRVIQKLGMQQIPWPNNNPQASEFNLYIINP